MVQLRTVLVIFVTLLCRELAVSMPRPTLWVTAVTTVGIVLGVGLLFRSFAVLALCQTAVSEHQRLRRLGGHRRLTDWLWCLLLPFALVATGWAQWLREFELYTPMALAIPAYFIPTLCVILLFEKTFVEFEQMVDETGSLSAMAGSRRDAERHSWWQRFRTRLKLGELASVLTCLAPVILMMFFNDLAKLLIEYLPVGYRSDGLSMGAASGLTFLMLAAVYPTWLSRLVGALELPEPWASRLEVLRNRVGVATIVGKLIPSQGRWSSAAIVGWFPRHRQLWLGDRLLNDLTTHETEMVILHELAHAKRWHFAWRLLPILATVTLLALVSNLMHISGVVSEQAALGLSDGGGIDYRGAILWAMAGCLLFVTIGFVARRCELDADATACRLALSACEWSHAADAAPNAVMASALLKLHDGSTARGSWLHPSLHQRCKNLEIEIG